MKKIIASLVVTFGIVSLTFLPLPHSGTVLKPLDHGINSSTIGTLDNGVG